MGTFLTKAIWTESNVVDLSGKTFLVTGSSSGMGFEAARSLAQHNARVIMASRNVAKTERAADDIRKMSPASAQLDAMELDLTSFRSIEAFADKINKMNAPLDVLVCNAGVFLPNYDHTQEGFEVTIGTNYFGHFYLTHLLLDKLRQSQKNPRVVFMGSTFEVIGTIDWEDPEQKKSKESGVFEYANSKIRKIMLARELNKRLQGDGIEFFPVAPGFVSTVLYNKADHGKLSTNLIDLSRYIYGQSAKRGMLPLLRAATDPTIKGQGGAFFSPPTIGLVPIHIDNAGMREPWNGLARDQDSWRRLYEQTVEVVNEKARAKGLRAIEAAGRTPAGAARR